MNDLNFFSEYILKTRNAYRKTAVVYAIAALVLLFVIGSYVATQLKVNAIEAEIAAMNEYLNDPETKGQLKEIEELKSKIKILSEYGTQLKACQDSVNKADVIKSTLLEKFNTALPKQMAMDSLTYTQNNITLKGTADDEIPVAELSYNLYGLGIFTEVHVSKISGDAQGADRYEFEATCALKGVVGQ